MKTPLPLLGAFWLAVSFLFVGCGETTNFADDAGATGGRDSGGSFGDATGGTSGGSASGGSASGGTGALPSACANADDVSDECRAAQLQVCAALSEADCGDISFCHDLTARRIDESAQCVDSTSEWVGCGIIGCGGLFTRATDPEGNAWLFPSTCHPKGWTEAGSAGLEDCVVDPG